MNRSARVVALCILIASICMFGAIATRAVWFSPDSDITVSHTDIDPSGALGDHAPTSSLPARLLIPSLKINAHVQHVGVAKSGNMAVPTNYTDVGWYRYGTVPGQRGNAVIDGHIDNGLSLAGVFKRLPEINIGDDIYIDSVDGQRLHFVVYDKQVYPYNEVPLQQVFGTSTSSNLNLITCNGSWLQKSRTYDQRVVVYTKLVQ